MVLGWRRANLIFSRPPIASLWRNKTNSATALSMVLCKGLQADMCLALASNGTVQPVSECGFSCLVVKELQPDSIFCNFEVRCFLVSPAFSMYCFGAAIAYYCRFIEMKQPSKIVVIKVAAQALDPNSTAAREIYQEISERVLKNCEFNDGIYTVKKGCTES